MAVNGYAIRLLQPGDVQIQISPEEMILLLKAWRNGHEFSKSCLMCKAVLPFPPKQNFLVCCQHLYFKPTQCYIVASIAVLTPGFKFALPFLQKLIHKKGIASDQDFIVIVDPIFWQLPMTLIIEKIMKMVLGKFMTTKSNYISPPSKAELFYKQAQEAPLNHGSLFKRSGGKNTLFRQIAYAKRCVYTARAMIVPNSQLAPNEIILPEEFKKFNILQKWIILNRMPSLQPENFVALRVMGFWTHDCFGIPLEILEVLGADFDGDETNIYLLLSLLAQAECFDLLNPERHMGSFTCGLKLTPCHDMLVAYYLFYDQIDFLPYKKRTSLRTTFKVIYDLYGSQTAFDCFNRMRLFYLDAMQNKIFFAITLQEILMLVEAGRPNATFEEFKERIQDTNGCLVAQVRAEAKGSFYHLFRLFVSIGDGVQSSFWEGLQSVEAVNHSEDAFVAIVKSNNIWQPGYDYTKSVYNLQGLHVNYCGQLVDGTDIVVENEILDALTYTDLMHEDSFLELILTVLMQLPTGSSTNC